MEPIFGAFVPILLALFYLVARVTQKKKVRRAVSKAIKTRRTRRR